MPISVVAYVNLLINNALLSGPNLET